MKFEKDLFVLFLRTILIFIFFVFLNLILISFFTENKGEIVNWNFILISSTILTTIILFFLTQSVEILKEKLILKNIFGLTINSLDLKSPYIRKVKTRNAQYKGEFIWGLFGKKYHSITDIYFECKTKKNKFYIVGQILTQKGLTELIKLT